MKNIKVKVEKNTLTLTVDLKEEFGLSKSQKTTIVASTEGNAKVEGMDGYQFGLNVFKKPKDGATTTAK